MQDRADDSETSCDQALISTVCFCSLDAIISLSQQMDG